MPAGVPRAARGAVKYVYVACPLFVFAAEPQRRDVGAGAKSDVESEFFINFEPWKSRADKFHPAEFTFFQRLGSRGSKTVEEACA